MGLSGSTVGILVSLMVSVVVVDGVYGQSACQEAQLVFSCRCWCPSVWLTVSVCVDSSLVRERRDCLVEAVAWYEASVVGQGDRQQQYYL